MTTIISGSSGITYPDSTLQSSGLANSASTNTAFGYLAGNIGTTTATNTVAIGYGALDSLTSGINNTAVGYQAGYSNTTGVQNTALGYQSLYTNATGPNNVAIGFQSLYSLAGGGGFNTACGYGAGYSLTSATAVANSFFGNRAGYGTTTGDHNTFIGNASGEAVTTGTNNTILGCFTGNGGGLNITTASNYIVLSDGAGNPRGIFDSSGRFLKNTTSTLSFTDAQIQVLANGGAVGGWGLTAQYSSTAANNGCIACALTGGSTTPVYIRFAYNGSTTTGSITTDGTNTYYTSASDYRLKDNVEPMQNALETVSRLNPVTYNWKSDNSEGQGFIAHELQEVFPACVHGEKDAIDENNEPVYQSIDTSYLVATLTKAIQELSAKNDALEARLAALESK